MQEGLLLCSVSATAWSGHGQWVGLPRAHQHPFPLPCTGDQGSQPSPTSPARELCLPDGAALPGSHSLDLCIPDTFEIVELIAGSCWNITHRIPLPFFLIPLCLELLEPHPHPERAGGKPPVGWLRWALEQAGAEVALLLLAHQNIHTHLHSVPSCVQPKSSSRPWLLDSNLPGI